MRSTAHRRPAAFRRSSSAIAADGDDRSAAAMCSSLSSQTIRRQACPKSSRRLPGQFPPLVTTSVSMFRHWGLSRNPATPFSRAVAMNERASMPEQVVRICSMYSSLSGSRRSTVRSASGDTVARLFRSFVPSQSASRHERRKRGLPSASRRPRNLSNGVRASLLPIRTSSSPSIKSVFPSHSGCAAGSRARKSRAVTRHASSPSALDSASNDVLLPEPGSPSST